MMSGSKDDKDIEARKKFFLAFNSTMIKIWRERITMLGVISTGALYHSIIDYNTSLNPDATDVKLEQAFNTYGIFQNFGTGRETPRGNPGDIGRAKVRKARRWFDKKYYSSVMNLRDFVAESMGQEYLGILSNALSDRGLKAAASS